MSGLGGTVVEDGKEKRIMGKKAGSVEGRQTTNGATASEGKKSGSSISEILQGLGPSSSFGEVGDADVILSLACNYLSACA